METTKSQQLFENAQKIIPGGVNSPVRACRAVGCSPLFIEKAKEAVLWDADGNEYIDFVGSWGPMIVGHAHPDVVRAVQEAATNGTSFGSPTSSEIDLATMVTESFTSIDKVRFVNSGTEATMSAVRLARGFTGKNIVVKFDGCYHGHADSFLVKTGSGVLTLGIPGSPGVPDDIVKNTISIPYNNVDILEKTLRDTNLDIACVIAEPVAGNMGCIPPKNGFLQVLRDLTKELGIILIFDEVITGFRLARGGAQEYFGISADLTTLGKIVGGGLPVGAYGGKAEIMDCVAPDGPVYQAGTLSGNPLAMAAGSAMLRLLNKPDFYTNLNAKAKSYAESFAKIAQRCSIPITINSVGSMMTGFFTDGVVEDFDSAMKADTERFALYFRQMLQNGIYLGPSQFETSFVSAAHTQKQLDTALEMTEWSFKKIGEI